MIKLTLLGLRGSSLSPNQTLRQERPNGANQGENGRNGHDGGSHGFLLARYFIGKKLEVKCNRETDERTVNRAGKQQGNPETYVTQIVKHKALPIKAMMLSKAGKRMAMTRNTITVATRTNPFSPLNAGMFIVALCWTRWHMLIYMACGNRDTGYTKPTFWNPVGRLQTPSNVTRLSRSLRRVCSDGAIQIIEYHSGVGSGGSVADVLSGGAFGLGISEVCFFQFIAV